MDSLEIQFDQDGQRGKYSVVMPDGSESRLTFLRTGPGHIIADHTFVPVPYREQGIAEAMVERLIADARANGDKITPTCWFVADEFTRHSPDWDDLLRR
ncbi:MAG: N-acetyltransferase [Brucellaceae bacterium]|nr:N-acetyltransferase [Brucellaceae bacterium]